MKTLKIRLLFVTFMILLLLSTYCLASNDVMSISETDTNESLSLTDVATDDENLADGNVEASFELMSDDLYRSGTDVLITEMVDGNAFVIGNTVTLSSEINGDLFVITNNFTIEENACVYGSVFVISNNITLNGNLYDIYAISNNVTLGETGYIARDARIASSSIVVNGVVGRNANLVVNDLSFPTDINNALILGNLNYISSTQFEIPEGLVSGDTNFTLQEDDEETVDIGSIIVTYVNNVLSALLYSLVVLLLIAWLAPNFIQKSGNLMRKKTPVALGLGLLYFFGSIIGAIVFLFLTYGLGSAISIVVIVLLVLLWSISETIFALAGGRLIARKLHQEKKSQIILYALLNVLVINIIKLIPCLGIIISVAINMIGLGFIFTNLVFKKQDFMTYEDSSVKETEVM